MTNPCDIYDKIYRRKGYIITYRDATNINWTQQIGRAHV